MHRTVSGEPIARCSDPMRAGDLVRSSAAGRWRPHGFRPGFQFLIYRWREHARPANPGSRSQIGKLCQINSTYPKVSQGSRTCQGSRNCDVDFNFPSEYIHSPCRHCANRLDPRVRILLRAVALRRESRHGWGLRAAGVRAPPRSARLCPPVLPSNRSKPASLDMLRGSRTLRGSERPDSSHPRGSGPAASERTPATALFCLSPRVAKRGPTWLRITRETPRHEHMHTPRAPRHYPSAQQTGPSSDRLPAAQALDRRGTWHDL